ncbi:MAG: winged helix-turn-helix domain-containing protein [Candidatus Diapherotrites archaeon]
MYEEIAGLKRSKTKIDILKRLASKPMTPTELSKELKLHQSSISRSIKQLEQQKLVECLTPKQYNYRHYQATEKGKKILKQI